MSSCLIHHWSFQIWLMRGFETNDNGPVDVTKVLAELMRNEQKDLRDGATNDSPGVSEEGESRINEDAKEENGRHIEFQTHVASQRHQQQPQPIIRWERFLPIGSPKVLLVENDDSTRQVVSALLKNCSYEVKAVSNGLEAWEIVEDISNRIDLILTEVVMPGLSGISLLSKIMNHKTCKNIPVIMMSSNDSMGIVFKCLSKGAADFLVKPIRKNELKNLWQHVWRKCHSSSGSGSESGTRTQKSRKSTNVEGSDNNTGSNDAEDNGSIGLNIRDGSDNGSGTQSSWSKRAVEVDSPQQMSQWDQFAGPPDSTCAQVIHSNPMPEAGANIWLHKTTTKKHIMGHGVALDTNLEIGVSKDLNLPCEDPTKKIAKNNTTKTNKDKFLESGASKDVQNKEKGNQVLNTKAEIGELRKKAADLVGGISSNSNINIDNVAFEVPTNPSRVTTINDRTSKGIKEISFVDLSIGRQRDTRDTGNIAQEQNVLRHSDLSAFTRYNTSISNQALTGNVGSCSPLDNSSEAVKTESMHNLQSNSNSTPNQGSNGSSNNNDMGSTTNNAFTKTEGASDKALLKSAVSIRSLTALKPTHGSPLEHVTPEKESPATINTVFEHAKALTNQVQVQHHHHHYHHHHHHIHSIHQQQMTQHQDNLTSINIAATAPLGESSNLLGVEDNAANYGSASGSNYGSKGQHGSSGQNGSSTALNAEGPNLNCENAVEGQCGGISESGHGNQGAMEQNKFSQREAALHKFFKKRKERCFEKKVRYQSRKKLAEQRPRVRGQFVRQTAKENNTDSNS